MAYQKIKLAKFPNYVHDNSGSRNIYAKEYENMSHHERIKTAALKASDNGRCWWIYEWIMLDLNNRR